MATGAQLESIIFVKTETDEFALHGRPCEVSANAFVPPQRPVDKQRNAFNMDRVERYTGSEFDRIFNQTEGYNQYVHRCDREHAKSKGLVVNDEEKTKDVPTLSSSIYGQKLFMHVDHPDRKHVRVAKVKTEFFRRNDINVRENVIGPSNN
ncbi:cilia- and flagella-associated protein 90-like [Watersipora subatra]|uniref:cilia- and flagella-associated protein 90-like n=1 Tax=Watersipora subatra TaxID=2589382 RepID=UPI00355C45A8